MSLIILSFIAGILTVLAPCAFTLLPIIIGGSVQNKSKLRPLIIIISLSLSILIFTLFIKTTSLIFTFNQSFWNIISGIILLFFGIITIWPNLWDRFNIWLGLSNKSDTLLDKAAQVKESRWQPILLGASLGPVFSSCSPTYLLLVGSVLATDFSQGFISILSFLAGLSMIMLAVGYGGRYVVKRLKFASNPNGYFKKILGVIFVIVGIGIIFGMDKQFEQWVIETGNFNFVSQIENYLQFLKF